MSGHIHLFIDETGRAYSTDFAGAPEAIWRATENRRRIHLHFPFGATSCSSVPEGVGRLQARLSGQKFACDGAARQLGPSRYRGLVGAVRCRAPKTTVRVARGGAEDCKLRDAFCV